MSQSTRTRRTPAADPVVAPDASPDRLWYATGTLLGADDLAAEQAYHRGRLARALAYVSGTGTVAGLAVAVEEPEPGERGAEDGEKVSVAPGMAIDPRGRIVEVPTSACTRLGRWLRAQPARVRETGWMTRAQAIEKKVVAATPAPPWDGCFVVDVFVRFHPCERGKTPAFAAGPYEALDAVVPSRIRDGYELSLLLRQEDDPPRPDRPWAGLEGATPAQRMQNLQEHLLAQGWREGTEHEDEHGARRLREHALTQDGTEVFLSRLVVPAVRPVSGDRMEGAAHPAPVRDGRYPVKPNDHLRRFVYPGWGMGWVLWR